MAAVAPTLLDWGAASRPLDGQTACGDHYLVKSFPDRALAAVIDGLGHGQEAAVAAILAVNVLEQQAADERVEVLLQRCHEQLRRTRGVALTLASFDGLAGTMTWLGVGNVEGVLFRWDGTTLMARESVGLRGGVVGYHVPTPRPSTIALTPGDVVILATDGIHPHFADAGTTLLQDDVSLQRLAERILADFGKADDDALVLAARYEGVAR